MFYEPSAGHGLQHSPLKALVAPRPIGWISTLSAEGVPNLAPFSFFNMIADRPPLVMFSSGRGKDSPVNAAATREFVVNIVGRALAQTMNATSIDAPPQVDEFDHAGLERAASRLVAPPRVAAAPAALECRVTEVIQPHGIDGADADATMVIGEIVGVHIDDSCLVDGMFDIVRAGTVARLGYMDYATVDATFAMLRPRWQAK